MAGKGAQEWLRRTEGEKECSERLCWGQVTEEFFLTAASAADALLLLFGMSLQLNRVKRCVLCENEMNQ